MISRILNHRWLTPWLILATGAWGPLSALQAQTPKPNAGAGIQGRVKDSHGGAVSGATVTVEGQVVKTTTAKDGSFNLKGVKPGPVFLQVKAPSRAHLDGETLKAVPVKAGATTPGVEITLSGRPSDAASYVGMKACAACHDGPHVKALNGT